VTRAVLGMSLKVQDWSFLNWMKLGDDLAAVVNRWLEELWQSEPLARHFVALIYVD
jgi:hypothetical protein